MKSEKIHSSGTNGKSTIWSIALKGHGGHCNLGAPRGGNIFSSVKTAEFMKNKN